MTELLAISLVVLAAIAALSPVLVISILLSKGLKTFLEHQKEYGISGGNRVDLVKIEAEIRKQMLQNEAAKAEIAAIERRAQVEAARTSQRTR